MKERDKWERRYLDAPEPFYGHEPSGFLRRSLAFLPASGRCLDLGGGQGRNAIFLAARGWDVLVVDAAVAGVARARAGARAQGVKLAALAGDATESPLNITRPAFDLVLMVNYHDRAAIGAAPDWLCGGGALLVEGFAHEQLGRSSGGPQDPAFLWRPNELLELVRPLRVLWYEDRLTRDDDNPRHHGEKWVVRLIARKNP